jgi:NADH:ubiquinone oxidoreductase subunit 5 (subunit L)/multisubunit Na+/H+ antiporter MnhA subunit
MLLLIVFLPLLGFFSGTLFGRFVGFGSCFLTTVNIFFSFLFSIFLFLDIVSNNVFYKITLTSWIFVDSLCINWCFFFDSLTSVMLIVITSISTLVHLYSTEYMEYDPHLPRFMSYLSFFTFFMLILVTADNFIQMFVG